MRFFAAVLALCVAVVMAENSPSPLKLVSSSAGYFSTKLFKQLAAEKPNENMISSPLSVDVVLGMASAGAEKNTYYQMRDGLHLPDKQLSREGYKSLIDEFNNVPNVTLEMANKMYLAEDMKLKPEFAEVTSGYFRSELGKMDVSNPEKAAGDINGWASEKTHGKVPTIVEKDDITSATRMVLLNAVYFKGNWANKFNKEETEDKPFHLTKTSQKMVPTMTTLGSFRYGELSDLKAKFIELPYQNKDLKMVIIVPDEIDGLKSVIDNLEHFNATRLDSAGWPRDVILSMPKFKIESKFDLGDSLKKLNMTDMFSNKADFSGISEEELHVGKVVQKAFIEVNEEGSEAAAVTGLKVQTYAYVPKPVLNVNRPFYFAIIHDKTELPLFNGCITSL